MCISLFRVDRTKYQIQIPLPPKIDPSVTMMTVEEKPDVTYSDIGGCKEQIERMREVVELPMLHPEKFVQLGIDPPKGVLCYGPPGTGKTLLVSMLPHNGCMSQMVACGSTMVTSLAPSQACKPVAHALEHDHGPRVPEEKPLLLIVYSWRSQAQKLVTSMQKGVPSGPNGQSSPEQAAFAIHHCRSLSQRLRPSEAHISYPMLPWW